MREVCKDPEQRRREIVEVVLGAVRDDKRPIRIPLYSNVFTWKICDAGYTMREATQDYDVMFDAVCQHHEKYHFDLYQDFGTNLSKHSLTVFFCAGLFLFAYFFYPHKREHQYGEKIQNTAC